MDNRTKELLDFLKEELFEIISEQAEKHRKKATQNENYIKARDKVNDIFNSVSGDSYEKLIQFESEYNLMHAIGNDEVLQELSEDFIAVMKWILTFRVEDTQLPLP